MKNYFNTLSFSEKLKELAINEFLPNTSFKAGVGILADKRIVILGCGAQGLNQGLNMRDSGLNISYALRQEAIASKNQSFLRANQHGFVVGTMEELLPTADLVCNLTPDKQHTKVLTQAIPLMKTGAVLSYSHGFNIVEEGFEIRADITVIMVAPKCPGTEVREEYKRDFGVPTLIAVHAENDPNGEGLDYAKAYAYSLGSNRAGVLLSSFVAEVKSDLMGEQTILCGVLQSASIVCFNQMVNKGINREYAAKLIQFGWETITEALKHGGVTNMMDRLSNPAKIAAFRLAEELKVMLRPLFQLHMDNILSGEFSREMMKDWEQGDKNLLSWREQSRLTAFEKTQASPLDIEEQEYFDHGTLLVAFVKSGVELAFEIMTRAGIGHASAYYESLHELPLIANTIAKKKLFEMNRVISDTAEYGCYLFDQACQPLITSFVDKTDERLLGSAYASSNQVNNQELISVNTSLRNHPIEKVGAWLRSEMTKNDQTV